MRKYASLLLAFMLVALVVSACVVRSRTSRRGQPVYVEKHKPQKHKKHKNVDVRDHRH